MSVCVRGRAECLTNITVDRVIAEVTTDRPRDTDAPRSPNFTTG